MFDSYEDDCISVVVFVAGASWNCLKIVLRECYVGSRSKSLSVDTMVA
jgi:hypothetical protein